MSSRTPDTSVLTRDGRDALIEEHYAVKDAYISGMRDDSLSFNEEDELKDRFRELKNSYFQGLPRMAISRCPFTSEALIRAIDIWGLDGFWWQEEELAKFSEPDPPSTFCVLTGAVNLNHLPPQGGPKNEAYVGPEVPYVIPRMLEEIPSLAAVISSISLQCGYTAYPIAYFSKVPPEPGLLTQTWRLTTYGWTSRDGSPSWNVPTDPWDFDLGPWIERERVYWIAPNDERLTVRSKNDGPCPFVDLPGKRERVFITEDQLRTEPPPSGEEIDPFAE